MYRKKLGRIQICRNVICLILGSLILLIGIAEARYAYQTDDAQPDSILKRLALYGIFLEANRP